MRKMLTLLIVLITCLSLSACGTWNCPEARIQVQHVYHYTTCGVEPAPNYVQLDPTKHLGSAENANVLIGNLEVMDDYNKSLINIIDCYEKQVEKSDDSKPN